jgi:hypothetical protein
MTKIDHHLHTSRHSPDSVMMPHEMIASAKAAGLDAVVITEHDKIWPADQLAKLNDEAGDLLILSGVEVSAREGHMLVYGLTDLKHAPVGISVADLLNVARGEGAAVVAAHPYRWGQDFDAIVAKVGPAFDGIEYVSNNVDTQTRASTERLLNRISIPKTGSSDAHEAVILGCYYTEFEAAIGSMSDFVAALKSGRFRPRYRAGARNAAEWSD